MRTGSPFLVRFIRWPIPVVVRLAVRCRGDLTSAREQLDPVKQWAIGRMPDAVVTDLVSAARQDMLQEAADELVGW